MIYNLGTSHWATNLILIHMQIEYEQKSKKDLANTIIGHKPNHITYIYHIPENNVLSSYVNHG